MFKFKRGMVLENGSSKTTGDSVVDEFVGPFLQKLKDGLDRIESQVTEPVTKAARSIELCNESFNYLRAFISNFRFAETTSEINFFKTIKPLFASKLIYYVEVYSILIRTPHGDAAIRKEYYLNEIHKLKTFFDQHIEFIKYMRSNSEFMDTVYFLRKNIYVNPVKRSDYFEKDPGFSTSHDHLVSQIIANDLLQKFLENKKEDSCNPDNISFSLNSDLTWTGSKVELTELVYALYFKGVFNNGNTDIKSVAVLFEKVFNVDLGDYYRTWISIRNRSHNKAKFLEELRITLAQKIREAEEKRNR